MSHRVKAAAIHLAISLAVAALVASLVFALWYPQPFREISGGRELFLIVVSVDVILGPLITLLVYSPRKPRRELSRDLAIVAALQLAGLAYGLHSVNLARPAVLALEVDRLRVVRVVDLADADWRAAPAELRGVPVVGIRRVATRNPEPEEKVEAALLGMSGLDLGMRPSFWLPSAQTAQAWAAAGRPLEVLRSRYPKRKADLDAAIAATGRTEASLRYLPLLARSAGSVALIDAATGDLVGHAPFDGH